VGGVHHTAHCLALLQHSFHTPAPPYS
jgi:hypothetical protein